MSEKKPSRIIPILTILIGIILIGIALVIGFSGNGSLPSATATASQSSQEIPRISLGEAKDAFDSGEALFVDVRDVESYNYAHIPGALNIPVSELESRLDELPKDTLIIFY